MTNYEKDWCTKTPVYYVLVLEDIRVIYIKDKQTEMYLLTFDNMYICV